MMTWNPKWNVKFPRCTIFKSVVVTMTDNRNTGDTAVTSILSLLLICAILFQGEAYFEQLLYLNKLIFIVFSAD